MAEDENSTGQDQEEEFSSAFAEFSGGPPDSDDPETEQASDESQGDLESSEEAPTEAKVEDEPEKDSEEDPWAALPEDVREKVKALEEEREKFRSDYLSAKGRLSKEVSQLARAKAALEARLSEMESSVKKPSPKGADEPLSEDDPAKFLYDEYPEIADPIQKLVESRVEKRLAEERKRIEAEISSKIDPVLAKEEESFYEKQYEKLAKKFSYYDEIVDTEQWSQWLEGATDRTKALAGSPYAEDVAAALTLFRESEEGARVFDDVYRRHGKKASSGSAPGNGRESGEVERVMKERKERLERAKIPPSKGGGTTHPPDADDFSSAFRVFSREVEKRGAAR